MTKLSVNVNKIATLRNTRHIGIPSPLRAARLCLEAGAHGITVHPRPDERHIRPADVNEIAELLRDYPQSEYNIEGNPYFDEFMRHCEHTRPAQATLVPDSLEQSTSDHGWDLDAEGARLRPLIAQLKSYGCRVSLFLDPLPAQVPLVREVGADRIELYTAPFAAAFEIGPLGPNLDSYRLTAEAAGRAGLRVNAGHDLSLDNLPALLRHVPDLAEVSIGHALIAEALEFGLPETVRRYLRLLVPCPRSEFGLREGLLGGTISC